MKAIIQIDVPDFQIGQEVSIYFNDTMMIKGIVQELKTGHWIAQDIHNCHTDFKCSECGYIHSFMHLYGKPTADYTYCPNCGADMRGDTDDNT